MVHLLFDTLDGYAFLPGKLGLETVSHYSPQGMNKYKSWLKGSLDVVRKARKGDTVICVYDFQGVLCYWISLLLMKKVNIMAVNILLKDKASLRNRVARFLYRKALGSRRVVGTVTTPDYGRWLKGHLGLDTELPILRDVYYESYERPVTGTNPTEEHGYVFCGGRNGRDWNFLLETARLIPDTRFKVAMPRQCAANLESVPDNVEVFCDIPPEQFNSLLAGAGVIAMPLDTEAPAGLIVIFQAAALEKPVAITSTIATRDYMADGRGLALDRDPALWAAEIKRLLADPAQSAAMGARLHEFLKTFCNEDSYSGRIAEIAVQQFSIAT